MEGLFSEFYGIYGILFTPKKRLFLPPRTMNCAKTVTTAHEDVTPGLMYGRAAAITPFHVQVSRSHLTLHYFCLMCLIFNSKHDAVVACSRRSDSIDCFQNNESAAMFVYEKKIVWELHSFHMLKLSFIPSILQSC